MARAKRRIGVIDAETDPFQYGRVPKVFAWGFYDGIDYVQFWGQDATSRLLDYLGEYPVPCLLYAHNGGKFDFFYLLEFLENPIKIINGRIVSATLGKHELRDSYSILPIPLSEYQKDEIDYRLFESTVRERHKERILKYLEGDCRYLHALVSKFIERFETKLTIGSTSIKELQRFHKIKRTNATHDAVFRPYYFGGRVEAFEKGAIPGKWKNYDVNSMYPSVMRNARHPSGTGYNHIVKPRVSHSGNIIKDSEVPYFLKATVRNYGALPYRTIDGLDFQHEEGEFFICSHELRKGLEYGLIEILSTSEAFIPFNTCTFDQYVDTFMAEKIAAKKEGNKANELFAKFILNSSYGKFGQNPDNYFDYLLIRPNEPWPSGDWELLELHPGGSIWQKPSPKPFYFDVAIAASITSASRAVLLDALQKAVHPIYCDTDSLLCESLSLPISDTTLGQWKLEAIGNLAFIGGKKLYALFDGSACVKSASKGVRLTGVEIAQICSGATPVIKHFKDAPNFKFDGTSKFVDRNIRVT